MAKKLSGRPGANTGPTSAKAARGTGGKQPGPATKAMGGYADHKGPTSPRSLNTNTGPGRSKPVKASKYGTVGHDNKDAGVSRINPDGKAKRR